MGEAESQNFDLMVQMLGNWYKAWDAHILQHGSPLDKTQTRVARCVGVTSPERVRVLWIPSIPMPHYPLLYSTLVESRLITPDANGLTVGYGILIKSDAFLAKYWVAHELVHVAQIERGGSSAVLRQYLSEILTSGYEGSSLEKEAHSTAMNCLAADESARQELPAFIFEGWPEAGKQQGGQQ